MSKILRTVVCAECGAEVIAGWCPKCGGIPLGSWASRGRCVGADSERFAPSGRGFLEEARATAEEFCASCPVRRPCLRYARDIGSMSGVFGGWLFEHSPQRQTALLMDVERRCTRS